MLCALMQNFLILKIKDIAIYICAEMSQFPECVYQFSLAYEISSNLLNYHSEKMQSENTRNMIIRFKWGPLPLFSRQPNIHHVENIHICLHSLITHWTMPQRYGGIQCNRFAWHTAGTQCKIKPKDDLAVTESSAENGLAASLQGQAKWLW